MRNLPIIVFDVNETLLDLRALDPHFAEVFGEAAARPAWFAQVLQLSMVTTLVDAYVDFAAVAGAALEMVAARRGVVLTAAARGQILGAMRALPPHPDVGPGLARLADAGFRLATLTNNPPAVVEAQLAQAGLSAYFERRLSVEAVRCFKPAAAVYAMAARELGAAPEALWLVAAHDWDVYGALRAGWHGAFVARPGMVLNALMPRPEIIGADVTVVADQLIARGAGGAG